MKKRATRPADGPGTCPFDGAALGDKGYCHRGAGYPFNMRCPFACPLCGGPLQWSGACRCCKGSRTPGDRATWIFPGDRYEFYDDRGKPIGDGLHWVLQNKGPIPMCSPEVNADQARMLARVLGAASVARKILFAVLAWSGTS